MSGGHLPSTPGPATCVTFVLEAAEDMYLVHGVGKRCGFAGLLQYLVQLSFSGSAGKTTQVINHTGHSICCLAQLLNAKIPHSSDEPR